MNIQVLFTIQKQLNDRIVEEHQLKEQDLFKEKLLAFLVEVGELANETRCFKYWSRKSSSERSVILEEYVDGLHFVLTLGLSLGFENIKLNDSGNLDQSVTKQFLLIMKQTHQLDMHRTKDQYQQLVDSFLQLGNQLGFSHAEIEESYLHKNKVNHQRQDEGY
ncbi:dUTP diphosphatase [Halalkalibacter kiskunsagensis]|uniref:dUTP diphosphatase n=1 Tax=Halalkalibacter kiskunsagensis TaxID=1548599 RepID=A0ABV6KBM4_9BACI